MKQNHITSKLPNIPNKRYFTIGEVAHLCGVKPHVLRYWEQEFPQLRPAKRRGNRRYYQRTDVIMVRNIRELLYDEGYTINGARIQLDQVVKQQKQADKAVQTSDDITYSYSFTVDDIESSSDYSMGAEPSHQENNVKNTTIEFVTELETITNTELQTTTAAKTVQTENSAASSSLLNASITQENHLCAYKAVVRDAIVELRSIIAELTHA
jgi:DNA-binding transcriptional MerR regulator